MRSAVALTLTWILLGSGRVFGQENPWPVKEFVFVAADDGTCPIKTANGDCFAAWKALTGLPPIVELADDIRAAADFYESHEFNSPNLEVVHVQENGGGQKRVYPVRSDITEFGGRKAAIAAYQSVDACYLADPGRRERRAQSLIREGNREEARRLMDRKGSAPRLVSDPEALRGNSKAVLRMALPHELFHAVQYGYPNVLKRECPGEDWFVEGMTDAMSLAWLETYHKSLMSDRNQQRIRGWRAYNAPLHAPWEPRGKDADVRALEQSYGTSSFWRFLGSEGIRMVLEFDDGKNPPENELEWLDRAVKYEWSVICEKLMLDSEGNPSRLPALPGKDKRPTCQEAQEVAGLYMLYPIFIAQFVESQRRKPDALSHIFAPIGGIQSERGPGDRKDGCFVAKALTEMRLNIPPVASECVRVPSDLAVGVQLWVELVKDARVEDLFLSWNGEVRPGFQLKKDNKPEVLESSPELTITPSTPPKIWSTSLVAGGGSAGDMLLVFSNVAKDATHTKNMEIHVTFLKDGGKLNVRKL